MNLWQQFVNRLLKRKIRANGSYIVLDVNGPEGQQFTVKLAKDRVTIGRYRQSSDIGLEPDPQLVVTQREHCIIERKSGGWWVTDQQSTNGTYVRRADKWERIVGSTSISDGDEIHILARMSEDGRRAYWTLTFREPFRTILYDAAPGIARLEYDLLQERLFRADSRERKEVSLTPLERKLIRYMIECNQANNNIPVSCTYDELIEAIWGNANYDRTPADVNGLVLRIRKKIELDPTNPHFFQNVPGIGYRLDTSPSPG